VEYTYRDLSVPYVETNLATGTDELKDAPWQEHVVRTYLFWTAHKWLSLTGEYMYEDFHRDDNFADGAKDFQTHKVPLGVNFFHPTGLSASLKGTYINQDGEFERQGSIGSFESGDDDFWLVDAALSYRFPKRFGVFTVGVKNMFDEEFEYFDSDRVNPTVIPDRYFFATVTFAIP
jgi:outer membrane receptor protein involved in Fe transport